jgi:hypothetical protein
VRAFTHKERKKEIKKERKKERNKERESEKERKVSSLCYHNMHIGEPLCCCKRHRSLLR